MIVPEGVALGADPRALLRQEQRLRQEEQRLRQEEQRRLRAAVPGLPPASELPVPVPVIGPAIVETLVQEPRQAEQRQEEQRLRQEEQRLRQEEQRLRQEERRQEQRLRQEEHRLRQEEQHRLRQEEQRLRQEEQRQERLRAAVPGLLPASELPVPVPVIGPPVVSPPIRSGWESLAPDESYYETLVQEPRQEALPEVIPIPTAVPESYEEAVTPIVQSFAPGGGAPAQPPPVPVLVAPAGGTTGTMKLVIGGLSLAALGGRIWYMKSKK